MHPPLDASPRSPARTSRLPGLPHAAGRAAARKLRRALLARLALITVVIAPPSWALTPETGLAVAAGVKGGTYQELMAGLAQVCGTSNGTSLLVRESSGSLESLSRLMDNEVQLAVVAADTVQARADQGSLGEVGLLASLHEEGVHVIVPREATAPSGFSLSRLTQGLGKDPAQNLRDLAGQKLASMGGSQLTAARLLARARIDAQVLDLGNVDNAMRALDRGEVQAVIAVGGAPLRWVSALPKGKYRLLTVSTPSAGGDKLYHPARLRYDNLGLNSVDTVAVDALLLARRYRKAESRQPLLRLQACLQRELDTLADLQHPAWRTVKLLSDPGIPALVRLQEEPTSPPAKGRPAAPQGAATATRP